MSEPRPVAVTGLSILTALGRGPEAQLTSTPAFTEVTRFDTSNRRVHHAATAAETGTLEEELDQAIATACAQAGVDRNTTPLLLALHSPPARSFGQRRVYTSACVSASTALADAATLIRTGRADRVIVAAAYLVEPHQYALFDAGRALATDAAVRPFSHGRTGTLLGDGVAAVVLEAGEGLAELVSWSRAGDAYHPVQPAPDGRGLATAIQAALSKANLAPDDIGYVNANATGTTFSDAAEAAALNLVFRPSRHGITPAHAGSPLMTRAENRQPERISHGPAGPAWVAGGNSPADGLTSEMAGWRPGIPVANPQDRTPGGVAGGNSPADGLTSEMVGWRPGIPAANPQDRTPTSEMGDGGVRAGHPPPGGLTHQRGAAMGGPLGGGVTQGRGPAVSSTKGLHGHALEGSGLVEFVVTVQALREGKLPVNAGFLAADPACGVDLILDAPRPAASPYGMSVNSAFGGANTALVVRVG